MIVPTDLCAIPAQVFPKKRQILLSIVHLCDELTLQKTLAKIDGLGSKQSLVEHILVCHSLLEQPTQLDRKSNIRVLYTRNDHAIPSLSFNLALAEAQGNWIWTWDADTSFSSTDIFEVIDLLQRDNGYNHLVWLQPPGDLTRGNPITINEIYNGLCPSHDCLIWNSELFHRWGCFDPHLVIRDTFAYEMVLRVIRHVRLATLPTRDGIPAIYTPDQLRHVIFYSDSRKTAPTFETWANYEIDDLSAIEHMHGPKIAWHLYLEKILPYYYSHRQCFHPGLFISPQSLPREHLTALFTKVQYETSNELTFWNYAQQFQGRRYFAFSYVQSKMLVNSNHQLDLGHAGQVNVLVSTRTADDMNHALLSNANAMGCATAYLTDDDLLSFNLYGEPFTSFRPGTPFYEAMTRTIRDADVVIGFSDQIASSTASLNKRYVHCEDSIPWDFIPTTVAKSARPVVRFGYAGSGYRTQEFAMLRPAIERICAEYGDAVQFSLWGIDGKEVAIQGNVEYVPFSTHYFEYLTRLQDAEFDAMLVPLMAEPAPKKAKNPNKFMEAVIANAVGLYSDVPSYQVVQPNVTGLKVAESSEAWYAALKTFIEMPEDQRTHIRNNASNYVRIFYSTPALAMVNETGLLAAQLHQKTRDNRGEDGRPLLAFFFPCVSGTGGGEIQLWRRFEMARKLGFRLLVVISSLWTQPADAQRISKYLDDLGVEYEFVPYNAFFTTPETSVLPSENELIALREFFHRRGKSITLAHSLALLPAVGMACSEFGVPHLASIYGIEDGYQFADGKLPFKYCDLIQSDSIRYAKQWSALLDCDWLCAREMTPAHLFDKGFHRLYVDPKPMTDPVRLSVVGAFLERKSQLETLEALRYLPVELRNRLEIHFYGNVDVYPSYSTACRKAKARAEQIGFQVFFHGHVSDLEQIYQSTDIVLSVSSLESFPSIIKESTAAGCLVVASHAGGITEMMVDGVNCFLVDPVSPEQIALAIERAISAETADTLAIRRNAYQLACEEFHPRRTLNDLALMYNVCIDSARKNQVKHIPAPSVTPVALPKLERDEKNSSWYITPPQSGWSGLDVNIEKPRHPWTGTVSLVITTERGACLRRVDVKLEDSSSASWVNFGFVPIVNSAHTRFNIQFEQHHQPIQLDEPLYYQLHYNG